MKKTQKNYVSGYNTALGWFLFLTIGISACTQSTSETYGRFQQLEGHWQATGSVEMNLRIQQVKDSTIVGAVYSHSRADTSYIESFVIFVQQGRVFYSEGTTTDTASSLPLKNSVSGKVVFENLHTDYPNRVIFKWDADSTYYIQKENSRGNKVIGFQMKRN
ncbi:MAG: hypothetical protein KKF98_05665 [Bacteroidetes bacterium]|nr:hypothetical protein [Bacteroidota bacterium]